MQDQYDGQQLTKNTKKDDKSKGFSLKWKYIALGWLILSNAGILLYLLLLLLLLLLFSIRSSIGIQSIGDVSIVSQLDVPSPISYCYHRCPYICSTYQFLAASLMQERRS